MALAGLCVASSGVIVSCVDEPSNPVVFDQVLESTTFENKLLARVVIFRDSRPIDTLNAREVGHYPIGRKGPVRHAWRIIAPIDNSGNPAGEQPFEDLGIQYRVRATYTIDNEALSDGTLFTPRIANLTPYSLRITANYLTDRQFSTNYTIQPNAVSSTTNAPYYYWVSNSNIRLTDIAGRVYEIHRDDSTSLGTLQLDHGSSYDGSGITEPIVVY
jgi:hypothetical protein